MLEKFTVYTEKNENLIDITHKIKEIVKKSEKKDGIVLVYTSHTTCSLTINENADPDVKRDILMALKKIVPDNLDYHHLEGNSPAHLKSSMMGFSQNLILENGNLILGTWQGVYLCEFDGPRTRTVYVKII
jgi:secondary thiamine-phosphate synthase enzyme